MELTTLMLLGVVVMFILLLMTVSVFVLYSGLLHDIKVSAGRPPIQNFRVVYKYGQGPYKDTGALFTEVISIAPAARAFGVYYDDPKTVQDKDLRWIVGCIVAEGNTPSDPLLVKSFTDKGYKGFSFPSVAHAVKTSFPFRTQLSIFIGIYRVYPQLSYFMKEKKLCAHPMIEIYDEDKIHYVAPLCKQDEFYVPEAHSEFEDLVSEAPESSPNSTQNFSSDNSFEESAVDDKDQFSDRGDSPGCSHWDGEDGSDVKVTAQENNITKDSVQNNGDQSSIGDGKISKSNCTSQSGDGTWSNTLPPNLSVLKHRRNVRAQSETVALLQHSKLPQIHPVKANTPKL